MGKIYEYRRIDNRVVIGSCGDARRVRIIRELETGEVILNERQRHSVLNGICRTDKEGAIFGCTNLFTMFDLLEMLERQKKPNTMEIVRNIFGSRCNLCASFTGRQTNVGMCPRKFCALGRVGASDSDEKWLERQLVR